MASSADRTTQAKGREDDTRSNTEFRTPRRSASTKTTTTSKRQKKAVSEINNQFQVGNIVGNKGIDKGRLKFVVLAVVGNTCAVRLIDQIATYNAEDMVLMEGSEAVDAADRVSGLRAIQYAAATDTSDVTMEAALQALIDEIQTNKKSCFAEMLNGARERLHLLSDLTVDRSKSLRKMLRKEYEATATAWESSAPDADIDSQSAQDNVVMTDEFEGTAFVESIHPDNVDISMSGLSLAVVTTLHFVKEEFLAKVRFPIRPLLKRIDEVVEKDEPHGNHAMLAAGKTQMGKTILKAVVGTYACEANCIAIVVTTNTATCKDLEFKIQEKLPPNKRVFNVAAPKCPESGKPFKGAQVREALCRALTRQAGSQEANTVCVIVVSYSASQLDKVIDAMDEVDAGDARDAKPRLVLLDEADDLYKNDGSRYQRNKQELSLVEILKRVALNIEITATPVPLIIKSLPSGRRGDRKTTIDKADLVLFTAGDNYIGVEELRPFTDEGGGSIFLQPGTLTHRTSYLSDDVFDLLDDALTKPENSKSLVTIITNPRVHANGGIIFMGEVIAERYKDKSGVAIIVSQPGQLSYMIQYPNDVLEQLTTLPKKIDIEQSDGTMRQETFIMSHAIDHVTKRRKWKGPIVVLGYTALQRGVSVRNDERVPTHVVAVLTKGMLIEKVIQAMGRGTGNMRSELQNQIGRDYVTILTTETDFRMATIYQGFIEEYGKEISKHGHIVRAFEAASLSYPLMGNTGSRAVGHKKTHTLEKVTELLPHTILLTEECPLADPAMTVAEKRKRAKELGFDFEKDEPVAELLERWNIERQKRVDALLMKLGEEFAVYRNASSQVSPQHDDGEESDSESSSVIGSPASSI